MSEAKLTATQKRAAVTRIDENLALRSGAGCGKTFVLTQRFTNLLLKAKDVDPLSRFVALTFTDKAALEMAQGVRKFLKEMASRSTGQSREKILQWLDGLPEARISTIHGFCAALLRGSAVEAGIDPSFAVCPDELMTGQMAKEAAEQAVLAAVEQGQVDASELLAEVSFEQSVDMVSRLIELRTACDLESYRDSQVTLEKWRKLFEDYRQAAFARLHSDAKLQAKLNELAAVPCSDKNDKLAAIRDEKIRLITKLLKNPDSFTADEFVTILQTVGGAGSPKAWGSKETPKAVRDRIREIQGILAPYQLCYREFGPLDRSAAAFLASLAGLAIEANNLYAAAKRAAGILDFTDLLESACRLIEGDRRLAKSLGGSFDQMLIDECQDTDSFQVKLLEHLIRGGSPEGELAEGRVFLVGDAKQSIYRFRGAQVEVFQDWCRRLGRDKQEDLDLSFRTHSAGAEFVNHVFLRLMGDDYSPIRAKRSKAPPGPCVEILLARDQHGQGIGNPKQGRGKNAANAVEMQAIVTAERIAAMIRGEEKLVWDDSSQDYRAVRPRDIAILFARMTESLDYERELERLGVPYYVIAGSGFFKQQEVYDVLNALRAIDNPFDDIALLGVLRSSLFGLDDNALCQLSLAAQPPYWPAMTDTSILSQLDSLPARIVASAAELLGALHKRKDAIGIDRIIQKVLEATGYEAVLLSQPNGKRMLGNVRMLLDRAAAAARQGISLAEFIAQMDELVISESRYEQAAVAGEAENVVRLMTIHKAKGLEFPVVFVPDLNAGRKSRGDNLLNRSDWGLTCRIGTSADQNEDNDEIEENEAGTGDKPLSFDISAMLENQDEIREEVRKLYVAATRAKNHLVFVGADWRNSGGRFEQKGSFLCRLDEALGIAAAMDGGAEAIPYGNGKYKVALRTVPAYRSTAQEKLVSAGRGMLAASSSGEELAGKIIASANPDAPLPPLLGALPISCGRVEIAVTALSDFARCPMLYRWRHLLRVPVELLSPAASPEGSPAEPAGLDAATRGTIFHRCMELLDVASPQQPLALITQAVMEMDLEVSDVSALAEELAGFLRTFFAHPLCASLTAAKAQMRELAFVMSAGPAALRGKIDLVYQGADGAWRIVDYKSDCIEGHDIAEHSQPYRLQLLAYATAAKRFLGKDIADATLYYLRGGLTHSFATSADELAKAEKELEETASHLIAACRSGNFEHRDGKNCRWCAYSPLCRRS